MRHGVIAVALAALLGACAHDNVAFRNGCWIRTHKSRLCTDRNA